MVISQFRFFCELSVHVPFVQVSSGGVQLFLTDCTHFFENKNGEVMNPWATA